jgi:MFS family permease
VTNKPPGGFPPETGSFRRAFPSEPGSYRRDSDVRVLSSVTRERAWTLTGLATFALAITLIHRQTLAALAATVTTALSMSDVEYGWLSTGMAATFLVGSLPAAQLAQRLGPRVGLAATLAVTSLVIGLHSVVTGFALLLCLRISMGLAVSPSFSTATHAIHRVLPFKDRARGLGLLYLGNSLGSAMCPPLALLLESWVGWRQTFFWVAMMGVVWIPIWTVVAMGGRRAVLEPLSIPPPNLDQTPAFTYPAEPLRALSIFELAPKTGVLRGSLLVAGAAPVTLIMLIWAAKYLVRDHGLSQLELARYLWLPALANGCGSLIFGELRARSARTRSSARPPRSLVAIAMVLTSLIAAVPSMHGPTACVVVASTAMLGAGGLYTLASSDMLAHAPRRLVPSIASFTTITQSIVYIVLSPIIGKLVQHFGDYHWVMFGAGLWVLPGSLYWLVDATLRPGPTSRIKR